MAESTRIEWTDATWNPITGCSIVSPGCTNCYAMRLAGGRLRDHPSRAGLTQPSKAGPVWTGEVRFNEQWLDQPLRWRKPKRIFVCAHGDLFHEAVPDEWLPRVFGIMAATPQHHYQVLTKRPERMNEVVSDPAFYDAVEQDCRHALHHRFLDGMPWPLPNVWVGTSAEDQERYDERGYWLRKTPAAVRFYSLEPLLGPIDCHFECSTCDGSRFVHEDEPEGAPGVSCPDCKGVGHDPEIADWIIVGGESGPGARPCNLAWVRGIIEQCQAAGVPCFVKQLGSNPIRRHQFNVSALDNDEPVDLSDPKGGNPDEWPANLWESSGMPCRIRKYPDG